METTIKKTNKATLIAAALIITGATAIFGTYAAENETTAPAVNGPGPMACYQMMSDLTEEEKAKMEEANELMEAGDIDAAREIMDELGFKGPGPRHQQLTDEQKEVMEQARELFEAGKAEEAKALLQEAGIKPPKRHGPNAEIIKNFTDEQREMLKKAHELMQAGDTEAAQAIFDELGLERPEKRPGNGFGRKPWQQHKPGNNRSENGNQ